MKHLALILTCLALPLLPFGQNTTDIAKKGRKSTVSIIALDENRNPKSYGSGFIIGDGLIATNIHVIKGATSVFIKKDEERYPIDGYKGIDKSNDLIILKSKRFSGRSINLGPKELPEVGAEIYAIGNPKGLTGTVSKGIISGIRENEDNSLIQITSPISPGSSGGPILDNKGQVIGVAFASYKEGQNLNFAIPVKYLKRLNNKNSPLKELAKLNLQSQKRSQVKTSNNGVEIRNIKKVDAETSLSFSVKNNLSYPVSHIKIIYLFYDRTGTVIDYQEEFLEYNGSNDYKEEPLKYLDHIKPNLAKLYKSSFSVNHRSIQNAARIKIRLLNFKILKTD